MGMSASFEPRLTDTGTTHKIIGAGGWVTGGDIADDGTIIGRLDTGGPIIRGPAATEWSRVMVAGATVDPTLLTDATYPDPGTYDVAICATNSAKFYFVVQGYVWKSVNGGATVTRTAKAHVPDCYPNDNARTNGKPLAVDPINGDVCFFGAPNGLHYTVDGGANWTSVSTSTIPAPTAGQRMLVAFDRNSAQTGGKTQGIYVFVNGSGLYRSTNGGSTWAAVAGAPTSAGHMRVQTSNGYVHLAGNGADSENGQYRRWNKSTWSAPSGISSKAIALGATAGQMWLISIGGSLQASTDHGDTFTGAGTGASYVGTDIPWFTTARGGNYLAIGDLLFHPVTGALWATMGIGVIKKESPPTVVSGAVAWTEVSKGIENMVTTLVDVTPNGRILYPCHDRICYTVPRTQAGVIFPATHAQPTEVIGTYILHGGDMDWAPGDENFLVCTLTGGRTLYSEDGGATWTSCSGSAGFLGGFGGNIVAFSPTQWVQLETNNGYLMRTADGGATWTRCLIGNNNDTRGHHAYWMQRRVLVRDEYVAGQAYYYHVGNVDLPADADYLACRGIWKTTDYGVTWTRIYDGHIATPAGDYYNGKLRQLGANDWLWSGGNNCLGLWRSTNGMASWAQLTGTDNVLGAASFGEVLGVAVGAPIAPSSNKTIYAVGHRQVTPGDAATYAGFGLWYSTDLGATWTRHSQFPNGYWNVSDVAADPTYNFVYVGIGGEGLSKIVI